MGTFTRGATRVVGGYFAEKIGGITTLSVVFLIAMAGIFGLMAAPSLLLTTLLFLLCFGALGAGNGATFQLVPLRWPVTTAVAGGMIGDSVLRNVLALPATHRQLSRTGDTVLAFLVLILMRVGPFVDKDLGW